MLPLSHTHTNPLSSLTHRYLAEVAEIPGAITLKSGMIVEVLHASKKDDAKSPGPSDTCEVTYLGTFKDGARFDGGTTSFAPNQVLSCASPCLCVSVSLSPCLCVSLSQCLCASLAQRHSVVCVIPESAWFALLPSPSPSPH